MAKPKQPVKHKKSKKEQPVPETADDFLSAGVDHEEAGEKWRSGDSAKSCRFFVKALDDYEAGLREFPQSFDLAYNKARLQFDISQQDDLFENLPTCTPLDKLLQATLESHRYALTLRPDDTDTLFNIAQILTCIAETTLAEDSATNKQKAITLNQEAVEVFEKCLAIQETRFKESQAPPAPSGEGADVLQPPSGLESESQWASVVEPITTSTLLDTCIAHAGAITNVLSILDSDPAAVQKIEAHSNALLEKASVYATESGQQLYYRHARFSLLAALADFAYRSSVISSSTYAETLTSAWASCPFLALNGPALCDHAEALLEFNNTLSSSGDADVPSLRWSALSTALSSLATANIKPGKASRGKINMLRGDIELHRAAMGAPPTFYEQAIKNRDTLLKNAYTYYDGARKISIEEDDSETRFQMTAKLIVIARLKGEEVEGTDDGLSKLSKEHRDMFDKVVMDMRAEGLLWEPPQSTI